MLEADNFTKAVAFYGAILSSIGFGWNLYRDLKDRARLKVKMHVRRIVGSPDGKWYQVKPDLPVEGASPYLFVVVNVTNIGRRPIKWTGWGGRYFKPQNGKPSFWIQPTHIPIMLAEGDSSSELTPELVSSLDNVKELFISDATGKDWHLSRRALKKLKEEGRKFSG